MSISQVTLMRPLPNRLDDFISRMQAAKSIFEKAGATVHTYSTVAGSEGSGVVFSSTVDDWDAWAKAAKATSANKDFENLQRESANDPAAEVLSSGIIEGFELPA